MTTILPTAILLRQPWNRDFD